MGCTMAAGLINRGQKEFPIMLKLKKIKTNTMIRGIKGSEFVKAVQKQADL